MDQTRKRNTPGTVGETTTSIVDAGTLMTRGQEGNVRRPKCVWRPLMAAIPGSAFLLGGGSGEATAPALVAKPVALVAPIRDMIDLGPTPTSTGSWPSRWCSSGARPSSGRRSGCRGV